MDIQNLPHGDTSWFVEDRFGLFIHWGLYALGARHEWLQHREQIPHERYQAYFQAFDPDLYDPRAWAAAAAGAGMRYVVATTKHHEGFCLWDSQLTSYKAPNTPAGRDLLRPLVEAFRAQGLHIGFYHSLIDWHQPDFVIDAHIGPYRNAANRAELNAGREQGRYADYLHGQIRELLTQFGKIDVLWMDFSYPKPDGSGKGRNDWRSADLVRLIRSLQPRIILNDRLDLPEMGVDVKTPEQWQPRYWCTVDDKPVVWEACQTLRNSWGYHREECQDGYRTSDELIRTLIDTVSKGGNFLLNVGPTGRGEIDQVALARLADIGTWMHHHRRAIHGCTAAPPEFPCPTDCRLTWNPARKRMYVHLFAWPYKHLHLDGFVGRVAYAQLLHDASEVQMRGLEDWQLSAMSPTERLRWKDTLSLTLPLIRPQVTVPVIELFLK